MDNESLTVGLALVVESRATLSDGLKNYFLILHLFDLCLNLAKELKHL